MEPKKIMLRNLARFVLNWFNDRDGSPRRFRQPDPQLLGPPPAVSYRRLERVVLTDEVSRTLFDAFAEHRAGSRGDEEIGWVLIGVRLEEEVLVLATLPAGTARSASAVHVRFDSDAQGLASRVLRQGDKRLTMVGVVHTHPGSLRHPSEGDFQGDSQWVGRLRGGEGVFGIGTADFESGLNPSIASQPQPHMQALGELCFSWYALGASDARYRRLPLRLTLGPDLARPLHPAWGIIEQHAVCLDRLYRQLANVSLEAVQMPEGSALALNVKLAEPGHSLRVLLQRRAVQYVVCRRGEYCTVNPGEENVERAVYLILAELAAANLAEQRPLRIAE
jgi:hypothetical protein